MKNGQGFLLVFSITSNSSLHELAELRDQIIRIKDDPRVPIVLVGNKSDLEEDRAVSRARAFAVSQDWGNVPYYETSARRRANVDEVFVNLAKQIISREEPVGGRRNRHRGPGDWPDEDSGRRSGRRRRRRGEGRSGGGRSSGRSICTIL
jgi:Ras-related protein Rap-1B